ncbi:hypothetical protein BJY00DRAFT_314645 [Aspergillus carlsbadensis]|nr:hypothetical protein BJY00DRAFT_314645 [Aspergillus carlsbadensis]
MSTPTPNKLCAICSQYACQARFATISYTFHNTIDVDWFASAFHRVIKASGLKVRGYALTVHALVVRVWLDIDDIPAPKELQSRLTFPAPPGLTVKTGLRGHERCFLAVASIRADIQALKTSLGEGAVLIDNVVIRGSPGFI